eukprot:3263323-Amphidinium_carterae.1
MPSRFNKPPHGPLGMGKDTSPHKEELALSGVGWVSKTRGGGLSLMRSNFCYRNQLDVHEVLPKVCKGHPWNSVEERQQRTECLVTLRKEHTWQLCQKMPRKHTHVGGSRDVLLKHTYSHLSKLTTLTDGLRPFGPKRL